MHLLAMTLGYMLSLVGTLDVVRKRGIPLIVTEITPATFFGRVAADPAGNKEAFGIK